ncbi:MAG: ABC transporter ATP-binding protein [Acidimicrobiales bacterium]
MTGEHAAPRVRFEGVGKRFGTTEALAEVDLDIPAGSFTVLLGPSGSGKSTLLRCLAGIERLGAGRVYIGDQLVSADGLHVPPERRRLAMVFQDYALWPHMTVAQNVAFALRRRSHTLGERRRDLHDALDKVGLVGLAGRYPTELSGGEQQRVALARALVGRPSLLLFDEPLSNLDADLRERLRLEISKLTRDIGATAVYITHDQGEAFALADQIGVLSAGRLAQVGSPEEIYQYPATPFVARFTGLAGELSGIVVAEDGAGGVTIAVEGGTICARAGGTDALVRGDPVRLLLRGAPLRLVDDPAVSGVPGTRAVPGVLEGRVIDVAFLGRGYNHTVELTGAARLLGIFDGERRARGAQVGVRTDASGAVAFREAPSWSASRAAEGDPASAAAVVSDVSVVSGLPGGGGDRSHREGLPAAGRRRRPAASRHA